MTLGAAAVRGIWPSGAIAQLEASTIWVAVGIIWEERLLPRETGDV